MTDEIKLKPCPFCGSRNARYKEAEHAVVCARCKARGCIAPSEEMAVDMWNERAGEPSIKDVDLPATEPLSQVPRVRYTDASGNVYEGWYVFHVKRAVCPGFDSLKPDDCMHCIVSDGFADWGMPQGFSLLEIDPDGGALEFIDEPKAGGRDGL